VWEHVLRESSSAAAPWYVIEGTDERYRNLTVGSILLDTLKITLKGRPASAPSARHAAPAPSVIDNTKLIRDLDLSLRAVGEGVRPWRSPNTRVDWRASRIIRDSPSMRWCWRSKAPTPPARAGRSAASAWALDARQYTIVPVAGPTDEERAHPYLWRFWRQIPARGGITIFDRSWYGRVLVERVEGFCSTGDWLRAYDEINQFEEQLTKSGIIVIKFWLQISKAEQLRRFREREHESFKRFKITPDDWRNRKRWADYERAVGDMVDRTSTELAPWTLVEAEDKNYARVKVLRTIVRRIDRAIAR
jgi:polyphosphate kinase 2 (PPK2 family)